MGAVRVATAAVAAVLLVLGVAAATSLGSFSDVVLDGSTRDSSPCTATGVELQNSLGAAVDLVTGGTVAQVELSGLTGDCDGAVPVIIVIGFPPLSTDEQVLVVQELAPISPSGGTATPLVPSGSDLESVADGLNVITEVKVAFCEAGATCT